MSWDSCRLLTVCELLSAHHGWIRLESGPNRVLEADPMLPGKKRDLGVRVQGWGLDFFIEADPMLPGKN